MSIFIFLNFTWKVFFFYVFKSKEKFLGDFEIDLTPYYMEGVVKPLSLELRNFKEFYKNPNHMPTDMRRKGTLEFDLLVRSNIK